MILSYILISSVMLALDNPLADPNGSLMTVMRYLDMILTSIFLCEAVMKMISFGLIINGPNSYLQGGWNIIDIVVVLISIISYIFTSDKLKIFKIFRMLKVLRPLRVISRNKGLKIGI